MNMKTTADRENQIQDQIKISHAEIAQRASQHWELAGHPIGRDAEFWLQAEAELFAAKRRGLLPEPGALRRARRLKQFSRSPQPFQDKKPGQKAVRMQEEPSRRQLT
jgi:hypothetical protein